MKPVSEKALTALTAALIIFMILCDQCLKFYVKLNYTLGEAHQILPFFHLCFVENDGMAFGIEWFNKLFLTLFRIAAVAVFCVYLHRLIHKEHARPGYILMVALVTAGAIANIIDCLFYGIIFSVSSPWQTALLFPTEGYAPLFYGKVVDMLYFPLIHNAAGETLFFRPVFNLADSCITVAIIVIFLFYAKDMNRSLSRNNKEDKDKA